ncbi:efflux RND transporter permease subunit [Wenzhouxiangella limi]|uniref:Efflux RND transporter permease subunit n=1 Tax=Wenzhouxiangella limi TaxID=2707351 RepID=A0A845UWN5_9GAMM|nr:efflux RND transporter permease subunit [Wenzhouxiangella limi]NDY95028.1 efflux RND transporter permease subunit [Wenzhouxiangella limi]
MLERLYSNHPLANIFMGVVLAMGAAAYLMMPREQDPEINFNWINMTTVLPGASAEDVERLITDPLEEAIARLQDVRFVVSSSRENVSNILIRFEEISEREFERRIADLRREVQAMVNEELPPEARDPNILEVTTSSGFPSAIVLLVGQADDDRLRGVARRTLQDLERFSRVDQILAQGLNNPELQVLFDPPALAARSLNALDLAGAAAGWYQDVFAGRLQTDSGQWLIRAEGRSIEPDALSGLTLTAPGSDRPVRFDDVARLQIGSSIPEQMVRFEGRPAVMLSVTKRAGSNTLALIEDLDSYIEERNPVLAGQGMELVLADDQTIATREAIDIMRNNAVVGLLLVFAVCWLFLATRIALLVGTGLILCVAGTFGVLATLGYTLNITVLLGVVIVLGMLVDVSVVMVEAIYNRLRLGQEPMRAATHALREVGVPLTASVLTTIAAFLPLMLLPGIVGKFMFVVPFVVTVGLLISLTQAFWILPTQVIHSQYRPDNDPKDWRLRFTRRVRRGYVRALLYTLRRPKRLLSVAALTFALALTAVAAGLVRLEFFAFDPIRLFYVQVDVPGDVALEETLARVEQVEARVREALREGEARSVTSLAGVQFTDVEPLFGDQYGQVIVSLNPDDGGRSMAEIIEAMRQPVLNTPIDARIAFLQVSGGPPTQQPINVKVRSDDFEELRRATAALRELIAELPGTRDISDDRVPGRSELVLTLDREAIGRTGLPPDAAARLLRLHVDGEIVGFTREAGERFELRVRAERDQPDDPGAVLDDPVALPTGPVTRLGALVDARSSEAPGLIRHYNLRRAITIEADIDRQITNTVEVNRRIQAGWEEIRTEFPGTDLDFSGELDDIEESLESMAVLFLLGLGLIYLILATQFRSYFQPFLILITVPMAFTGVVFGLLISNNPLSLYTMYGIIALAGIAVNAAIVLIDAANQRLATGMRPLHATIYAARRRVIPILMTTATTIAGLLSLAIGLGGRSLLWGPVAVTLVWGLTVSALLTLFVIPLLYRLFMRGRATVA